MAIHVDFLLPRRPLSHQTDNKKNAKAWRDYIFGRAFSEWKGLPITKAPLKFTVVYLCEGDPGDINNIIKPIQDAINALVYSDDSLVWDVSGHMRLLSDPIDLIGLPDKLAEAVIRGVDCVYVRVSASSDLATEVM